MYYAPLEEKVRAVRGYLRSGQSLKKFSAAINVSHQTLWRWVKQYKEGGKESLRKEMLHKKRLSKEIIEKVMLLKEQHPSLTIRKARQLLSKLGVPISNSGIWKIWKRYGFIGSEKRRKEKLNYLFIQSRPELEYAIKLAGKCVNKEDYKGAAKILNELPCLPECPLLKRIPEKFLSPRRKLERLFLEYKEMPYPDYLRKAKQIRRSLEKKGYMYSSIFANFMELNALKLIGRPAEKLVILKHLSRKMKGMKDTPLWYFYHSELASTYLDLQQVSKAFYHIHKCRRLVYHLSYPNYWVKFASLSSGAGNYKDAFYFFKKFYDWLTNKGAAFMKCDEIYLALAACNGIAGEYPEGKKMLAKAQPLRSTFEYGADFSLANASLFFGQGNLVDASNNYYESLEKADKINKIHNSLYASSIGLAAVSLALNKKTEAKTHLKKYLGLFRKHKLISAEFTIRCFSGTVVNIPRELKKIPSYCLLHLLLRARQTLRITDYRKAFNYAKRHKHLGLFHRAVVFFPEPVLRILEKGKQTGLPKAILKYPVFNQSTLVYHIKFFGNLAITKNQQYLRAKLSPKEQAFLIHLALRANAPGKSIMLSDIFRNFWLRSNNPANLFSHLLMKIRKKLKMPRHLLSITSKSGDSKLINNGIYITTDYKMFETLLIQANTLERAEEWGCAKREYLRAFRLFRGNPFEKMYDNWSEDMRAAVLNKLENNIVRFLKECLNHKDHRTARKIPTKAVSIIKHSKELEELKISL